MGTRNFAQVPPTAATIALNSFIYGYAGHSLVTPHAALKQLWWTDDRIERKVTRHFVVGQIRGEEREFLDKPLAFGEGLTDDTYMEWILERARRLFLILTEVGKPEQIFGLIDDSVDDGDLPFSIQNVRQLELSIEPDDRLNKKFYDTQFLYLLRSLGEGSHVDYGPNEHIPMEFVPKFPPAVVLQCWDRIHFPSDPDTVFLRRKFELGPKDMQETRRAEFMEDVAKAKYLMHEHICPIWGSYTTADAGYVLSEFVPEHTLGTFIAQRLPYQFLRVSASERPVLVLEWLHCLADALASLHHRGTYHGAIRPSNIIIDHDNRIAFSDVGSLRTFQRGKRVDKKEVAEYAPPEMQIKPNGPRVVKFGAMVRGNPGEDQSTSSGGSTRSNSVFSATGSSVSSPVSSPLCPSTPISRSFRNFSRHISQHSNNSAIQSPVNATVALAPLSPSPGRSSSLATTSITTITPSLPPPRDDEISPCSSISPWSTSTPTPTSVSFPTSGATTPRITSTAPNFAAAPFANPSLQRTVTATTTASFNTHPDARTSSSSAAVPEHPEAADVFSLGCIFLDILTWLVKGRLNEFIKFRSTPLSATAFSVPLRPRGVNGNYYDDSISVPNTKGRFSSSLSSIRSSRSARSYLTLRTTKGSAAATALTERVRAHGRQWQQQQHVKGSSESIPNTKPDSSFAGNLGPKLELWIEELVDDCVRRIQDPRSAGKHNKSSVGGAAGEAIYMNGIPELLRLVRNMLSPDAEQRPSARAVREAVQEALGKGCGIQRLCCRGRVWECGGDEGRVGKQDAAGGRVGRPRGNVFGGAGGLAGVEEEVRLRRVDTAIETERSGGVPVRRRKVGMPWQKRERL